MPDFAKHRALTGLATVLLLAGCFDDAPEAQAPAITGTPEFVQIIDDARGEMREGNLSKAGGLLDEALRLEPDNADLWVTIARLRFRGGEHFSAVGAADRALELDPKHGPAILMRAQLVRDANGLAEALPWFESAVQADPRNAEAMAEYAATLGDLGRHRDMLKVVRELHKTAGNYPPVFYLQAVLAARANQPVLARSLLAKSGLFQRGVPSAMLLDALIDIQQQSPDTAVETLQKLAQRQPANRRVEDLLALALWQSGRDEELISQYGERARANDATPYLTMLVGRAYERLGNREAAAPLIESALAMRDVQMIALETRAGLPQPTDRMRAMISAGTAPSSVQSQATALITRFPDSSDIAALAGDGAYAANDITTALTRFTKAGSVRRPWPLSRKIIAATRAYGDDKAADALLRRAVIGDPRNPEALLMLAQRQAQLGEWARVSRLLNLVLKLGAGNDPKVFDLMAQAAEAQGNAEDAVRWDLAAESLRPGKLVR